MTKAKAHYLAFLLRLWCEDDEQPWRATLESSRTGERRGFASLGALVAYLLETTGAAEETSPVAALDPDDPPPVSE